MEAEEGTIKVSSEILNLCDLFSQLEARFASRVEVHHWRLGMQEPPMGWTVHSDPKLLLRIFQRSFSTKGAKGRGLGTYSMKLFGETYLGGQVSFRSSAGAAQSLTNPRPGPPGRSTGRARPRHPR